MLIKNNNAAFFSPTLFADKVYVVTGGGQGIGKAIAQLLQQLSATVVVVEYPRFIGEIAGCDLMKVDLSLQHELSQCFSLLLKRYGRCDGLINNARAGSRTKPLEESVDNINAAIAVGLTAPTLLSQLLIDYAKTSIGYSRAIVNISSTAARSVSAESASYHATKASLEGVTRYFAVYGGAFNVRVNAIAPGFIVKPEHQQRFNHAENADYRSSALAAHPLASIGSVHDVANAVAFLLSDAASFINGQTLCVDGGLTLRDSFASATAMSHTVKGDASE